MVTNVHERVLDADPDAVGSLIDALASSSDGLWPAEKWPAMRFDRPLAIGARGGHGPIRYVVEDHLPGRAVRFRFRAPTGFDGYHEYVVLPRSDGGSILRHSLLMNTTGLARLSWPIVIAPLHDALIEDSFDKAIRSLKVCEPAQGRWNIRVKVLRALALRRRASRPPSAGL
jgi:hypothetical protein